MKSLEQCRCGSTLSYAECCDVLHSGQAVAATAEALMRSRYCAFALKKVEYLLKTWCPSTLPQSLNLDEDATDWHKLQIIKQQKGGVLDKTGKVEFKAFYQLQGELFILHELSRFEKQDGRWVYIDGIIKAHERCNKLEQPKNALCECGSGKKFKRCCGVN